MQQWNTGQETPAQGWWWILIALTLILKGNYKIPEEKLPWVPFLLTSLEKPPSHSSLRTSPIPALSVDGRVLQCLIQVSTEATAV